MSIRSYYESKKAQISQMNMADPSAPNSRLSRYKRIYDDMSADPVKYYNAYNGNVKQFQQQQNYLEHMMQVSSLNLPDNFTHYAYLLDDMSIQKDEYVKQLGSEAAYNNQVAQVRELYGIEKANAEPVINLVSDRVEYSELQAKGLDKFYQYDDTSAEDMMLQQLRYAPLSFYTKSDIAKRQETGYSANKFLQFNDDGSLTDDAAYLLTLYKYDQENPEDMLNQALGLMPTAFGYSNSAQDKAREAAGELPEEAEKYITNSRQFDAEYNEYSKKMQEYADALYKWENGPNTGFLGLFKGAKPKNPYEDGAPETIQALKEYYIKKTTPEAETAYEKFTGDSNEIEAPFFAFSEDMPVMFDETMLNSTDAAFFHPSEAVVMEQQYKDEAYKELNNGARFGWSAVNENGEVVNADQYVKQYTEERMYQYRIDELKEQGLYDEFLAEQKKVSDNINSALTEGYTPENYAYLVENLNSMENKGTASSVEDFVDYAVGTLKKASWSIDELRGNAVLRGAAIGGNVAGNSEYELATDAEMREIRTQLDALGWKGESQSDNAQIQALIDKATYKSMQAQTKAVQQSVEAMKNSPSWLIAIASGLKSGVSNVADSISTTVIDAAKATAWNPFITKEQNTQIRDQIGNVAADIAFDSQDRVNISQRQMAAGEGGLTPATNLLYNAVSTATEMGIELAMGNAIGAAVGGGAAAAEGVASAKTLSTWGRLSRKLLLKPQMIPFFTASLGHNLMYGELQGRTDVEKWAAALPAAYVESVMEGMLGFFSTPNTGASLFRNGIQGLSKQTALNLGRTILENTLGEALEENMQDISTELIRNLMWNGYDKPVLDFEQMGDTTLTTIGVGLLMTMFGIPAGFRSYQNSRNVENIFNKAIEAYDSGDTETFSALMTDMRTELGGLMVSLEQDMKEGNIEKAAGYMQLEGDVDATMKQMYGAVRNATTFRQMKEAGQAVPQSAIEIEDARANRAINALKSFQGFDTAPATLYDQIASSETLVQMVNANGFAADLIRSNGTTPLTNEQLQILQNVWDNENSYVGAHFPQTTTIESTVADLDKQDGTVQSLKAEIKRIESSFSERIKEAYSISKESGKQLNKDLYETRDRLKSQLDDAEWEYTRLSDIYAALNDQFEAKAAFDTFKPVAQTAEATPTSQAVQAAPVQSTQTDNQVQAEMQNAPQTGAQGFINDTKVNVPPLGDSGYIYSAQFDAERYAARQETLKNVLDDSKSKKVSPAKMLFDDQATQGVKADNAELYRAAHDAVEKYRILRDQINDQSPDGETPNEAATGMRDKLRKEAHAAIDKLMNSMNIGKVVEKITGDNVFDTELEGELAANHLRARESAKANGEPDEDPMVSFNALETALDIIAYEAKQQEIETQEAGELDKIAKAHPKKTVIDELESAKQKVKKDGKIAKAASNLWGVESYNADQFAGAMQHNEQGFYDEFLWNRASDCYNRRSHYYLNDQMHTKEFTDSLPKPFRRAFSDDIAYQFKLEGKKDTVSLTMRDIVNIWGNVKAGNNILPGFKLTAGQEVSEGEATTEELADIANVIDGKNINGRTQQIIDALGKENVKQMRKVADFAWKFYNDLYYENQYGERIEAPKARLDIMGYEVYGIKRSRGDYWPTITIYKHASRGTIKENEAKSAKKRFEFVKGENKGKVIMPDVLGLFDQHSYETAHAVAFGKYQRELHQVLYRYGLRETIRSNQGESFANWMEEYRQNILKPTENMSDIEGLARALYNNVKLVKLISPSVWVQQFAGIIHAGAFLNSKYFPATKAFTPLNEEQQEIWRKYMPSAMLRSWGYSARETTEAALTSTKRVEIAMKPLVWADVWTCKRVLQWAYNQVRGEQPNLKGDAFKQEVGRLARHTIERTQGTYAPHSVSMLSQKTGFGMRTLTMFTTQTNSLWNSMVGGFRDFATGNKKAGFKKLGAVVLSNTVAWAIGTLISGGFKDWDDETLFGKVTNISSIITGNIYGIRNLQGLIQYKSVDIPVQEQATDFSQAVFGDAMEGGGLVYYYQKRAEANENYAETKDQKYLDSIADYDRKIAGKWKQLAITVSQLAGVPLKSVEKYIVKPAAHIGWGEQGMSDYNNMWGYELQPDSNYDDLNDALTSGNRNEAMAYIEVIANKGGNLQNWLDAKTGGQELTPEQQLEAMRLWNDATIKMGLDSRRTGE